jgi:hypothetical protein
VDDVWGGCVGDVWANLSPAAARPSPLNAERGCVRRGGTVDCVGALGLRVPSTLLRTSLRPPYLSGLFARPLSNLTRGETPQTPPQGPSTRLRMQLPPLLTPRAG